jgi:hypothetical protein
MRKCPCCEQVILFPKHRFIKNNFKNAFGLNSWRMQPYCRRCGCCVEKNYKHIVLRKIVIFFVILIMVFTFVSGWPTILVKSKLLFIGLVIILALYVEFRVSFTEENKIEK